MKSTGLAFVVLIVGTLANPLVPSNFGPEDQRIVTGQIIQAIEDLSERIKDEGLDPFEYSEEANYELPVPILFAASAFVDTFVFTGLSNIAVNDMSFAILSSTLRFDISLPRLAISIANSGFEVVFFGKSYEGSAKGSLAIIEPRFVGNVRVNIGIISGITIRSLTLAFSVGSIESNLEVGLFNRDLSESLNAFLSTNVPVALNNYENFHKMIARNHTIPWTVLHGLGPQDRL